MSKSLKKKILFKIVRLPVPWHIRYAINFLCTLLTFRFKHRAEDISDLIYQGYKITNTKNLDINDKNLQYILYKAKNLCLRDQWRPYSETFSMSNVPSNVNVAEVLPDTELSKLLLDIGTRVASQSTVSSYFFAVPELTNISLWWSFGGRIEKEAQLWHRDLDNILFLKVFIYLTTVDNTSGPHMYIPGSHRSWKALSFKRFTDSEVTNIDEKYRIERITGKNNSVIIEDTFGLHRGSTPMGDKNRLILQFQYSLFKNP